MTTTNAICKSLGMAIGGGILVGGIGAGLAAAAGTAGSALLQSYDYSGYNKTEAAQMGALGGSIVSGSMGVIGGLLASCGVSLKTKPKQLLGIVSSALIDGLIGYSIMNSNGNSTEMPLGQTAAAFAVGAAITLAPLACLAGCSTSKESEDNYSIRI